MLRKEPPSAVRQALSRLGIAWDQVLLCTDTDIDRMGRYVRKWLVITAQRLLVISEEEPAEVVREIELNQVEEYRCQSVIGSGLLQVKVDGMYIDMLRYSNRMGDKFHKVARKLERFRLGEPIVLHPEDDIDPRRCPSCNLMLSFPGDVCPRCVSKGAVLARMWVLMKPYRGAALTMMALLMVGIALDLVAPQLTRFLVDRVLPGSPEQLGEIRANLQLYQHLLGVLLTVVGVLALTNVSRMGINMINGRLGNKIGTAITFDMRGRLVSHLQQLSVGYYDRQQVGSLVGRVAYDTESLHGFVNQLTSGFLFQLLMVIGVGTMMFILNAKLALFTLIPAPLVIAGSIFFWRYIYPRYYRFWDASSKQAGMLSGVLSGIRVVKAFSQEQREIDRFNRVSGRLRDNRLHVDNATALFNPCMAIIFQMGGWIVWYVGGRDVLGGTMTLGSLIAFFAYQAMFYGPLTTLTQFTNWLTQFATQAHRIFEILDTPIEITEARDAIPLERINGHILFDNVTFGYTRNMPVIQDVTLEIQPGEMIGVVGRSGSGKTTLINLLSRFYDVELGAVKIDGIDVRRIRKDDLRSRIGVVLQEPFLFRGSIWDNIAYGRPDATPTEVFEAAKAGNCHDFIMRQAHGYDTWIGERGAGLSGGERQRIGISRVLLTDPKILILDEATSNVDAESEAAIQAALAEVVRNRTTIAIAHRLSTLRSADRIVVVDRGRIAEMGTHQELLERDGIYARLVKIQGHMTTQPTIEQIAQREEDEARDGQRQADEDNLPIGPNHVGPLPHPRGHHVRWLTPDRAHIHSGSYNTLHLTVEGEGIYRGLFALRCLPVHYPEEYISLRMTGARGREIEVGIIRRIADWPETTQQLVREALLKRYLVHTITAIESIQQFSGYLNFRVQTDLGPLEFMLRWQADRAHDYGPNGRMLLDTEENRYLIPDLNRLTEHERKLFQRYIYW